MTILSYAQNQEDVLLHRIFGGQGTGFYIDVGAFDPINGSVTKALYDRGWSGINVEPGDVFETLAAARPRDVNLRLAVMDRGGEVDFNADPVDPGMSSVMPSREPTGVATKPVPCDTLENIVRTHAHGRPIDLLKIDAEGAELLIVRSTDWRQLRPRVLLIEATLPWSSVLANQEWEPILLEQGYLRAYFDGINCFYVPEERSDLLAYFEVPVNALDGFQRFDPQLAAAREQVGAARAERDEMAAELARVAAARDRHAEQEAALAQEVESGEAQLASARRQLDALSAGQSAALAAVVDAHAYQVADLHRQLSGLGDAIASLQRERDALLGVRDQAARYRRLLRELQWPDGPAALRAVLPLARLLRRIAGTRVPPMPPEEAALFATSAAGLPSVPKAGSAGLGTAPRRSLAQRAAWLAYRPLRPLGRPAAWRLRAFLTLQIHSEFVQLEEKLNRMRDDLVRVTAGQFAPAAQAGTPGLAELQSEIRQFSKLLEDTLLTLAMVRHEAASGA